MADIKIGQGMQPAPMDFGEIQEQLGLPEEMTSLPEWKGLDRMENGALAEPVFFNPEWSPNLSPVVEQLRTDPEYENLIDLDEKRFILDVMDNVSQKLDSLAEEKGSEQLLNFRETFNELLELYQEAYTRQLANVKG